METMTNPMTSHDAQLSSRPGFGFAMPNRVPTTGLSFTCTSWTLAAADRTEIEPMTTVLPQASTKGHVALVAYVSGLPAWSPPLC